MSHRHWLSKGYIPRPKDLRHWRHRAVLSASRKEAERLSTVGGLFGSASLSAVLGVNNAYAAGIAALLIVIGSVAAFMLLTGRWSVNRAPAR